MAKKETTKKSVTKKTTPRKKAEKPVVEAVETVMEEVDTNNELIDVEEAEMPEEDEKLKEQVLKHVASEILVEKNNDLDEFVNTPKEEMVKKAKEKIEDIKKINNHKVNERINHLFGYLWNGQEMDY
jgi:hypothetical protein